MRHLPAILTAAALTLLTACCHPPPKQARDFGFPVENLPTEKDASHTGWGALPIYTSQMMWVKNLHETALIHFTKFEGDRAWYRYRLYNYDSGKESRGIGEVFEKMEIIERNGKSTKVRDAGSQTHLRPGTFDIGWSKANNTFGWIYLGPDFWDLRVIDASLFETFPFRLNRPDYKPEPD